MSSRSVLKEAREVELARSLIELGARLQFLEVEVDLSRERLIRLYKEIKGASPPKGLLPFSVDWYMTWRANIHASLFYNIYCFMLDHGEGGRLKALIRSYQLYLEQVRTHGGEAVVDFTRAYTMVRFFESDMLQLTSCSRCDGKFVAHAYDNKNGYVCVLCRPPSRAGKVGKPRRTDGSVPAPGALACDADAIAPLRAAGSL